MRNAPSATLYPGFTASSETPKHKPQHGDEQHLVALEPRDVAQQAAARGSARHQAEPEEGTKLPQRHADVGRAANVPVMAMPESSAIIAIARMSSTIRMPKISWAKALLCSARVRRAP